MKKIIIAILVFIGVIGIIAFFRAKKVSQTADMIDFDVFDFKFNITLKDIASIILTQSIPAVATISANNYSKNVFTIRQLKADIYTPDGTVLAYQDHPLNKPEIIIPNTKTLIDIPYTINASGIIEMYAKRKNLNPEKGLLKQILIDYVKTGKIGEEIIIKGFVIPDELKGIKIKLNEKVEL